MIGLKSSRYQQTQSNGHTRFFSRHRVLVLICLHFVFGFHRSLLKTSLRKTLLFAENLKRSPLLPSEYEDGWTLCSRKDSNIARREKKSAQKQCGAEI